MIAVTIAGSDSGGGAGIQADLKTFEAHGVFGATVITALTAQNTQGVFRVEEASLEMVEAQLKAVFEDFKVGAVKTGMLSSVEIIRKVGGYLGAISPKIPLVVDPVMVATSGDRLLREDAVSAMKKDLLVHASLVTPNLHEAEILAGMTIQNERDMLEAARLIGMEFHGLHVLLKGGHLADFGMERPKTIRDLLWSREGEEWFCGPYIDTPNTHGTGCTLSASIAANLALGFNLRESVRRAKEYITDAIRHSWSGLGKGGGSLRHGYQRHKGENQRN